MTPFAVLLVLSAAVAHAAWNVIAHGVSRIGLPFLWLGAVSSVVVWIGVVPFTGGLGTGSLSGFLVGIVVSGLLHVAYMLVLQRGYRVGQLSTVYATARGTGPTISVVLAITLLGERPSWWALAGGLLVLVGVVAVGLADRGTATAPRALPRRRLDPGIVAGLLTGVAIAAYTIWDAHLVRGGVAPVAFMVGCTAVEIVLFGAALGPRRREVLPVLRAHWGRVLAFGVLSPLSYILVLVAITIAPVALVAPMREVSVVLVSVFGVVVLREGRAGTRIAASVVVLAGIALLAV
ncbi:MULTISPECIES: EamA family transporter [unclassified Curtobacterium]|uniref:EamA family transporter n=1 Tax=unclassified Curtobacterium TaxID=257496 RepID=UPI00135BE2C6|nr:MULTISPECIES: EamA family transporter [unclassified Curtobacterium]MBF4587750.1 EamA family transporter [Curtobacterium sp. VKM Ac-2887]